MSWLYDKIKGDLGIWAIVMFLSFASLFVIFSSADIFTHPMLFLKHLIFMCAGLAAMYVVHMIDYRYFAGISKMLIWIVGALLLFTLVFGMVKNDAARWVSIPVLNLTIQPSDIAKVVLVIYISRVIARKQLVMGDLKKSLVPILLPIVAYCVLIGVADFSTAAVLFMTCFVIMIIGRVAWSHIAALAGLGAVGLVCFVMALSILPDSVLQNWGRSLTWKNRIVNYMDDSPNKVKSQQVQEATHALCSGGLTGRGPGNGQQRSFLPGARSDYVYAVIVEEYGLMGGFFIAFLYFLLFERCLLIFKKCKNSFGALVSVGLGLSIVIQAFVHMLVVVGVMPVTGLPLPLISKGGTSMFFTCIALGIILSVSRQIQFEESKSKNTRKNKGSDLVPAGI